MCMNSGIQLLEEPQNVIKHRRANFPLVDVDASPFIDNDPINTGVHQLPQGTMTSTPCGVTTVTRPKSSCRAMLRTPPYIPHEPHKARSTYSVALPPLAPAFSA